MGICVEIIEFKKSLISTINNCKLPYSIKQLVLKETLDAVNGMARQEYETELASIKEKEAEECDSNNTE